MALITFDPSLSDDATALLDVGAVFDALHNGVGVRVRYILNNATDALALADGDLVEATSVTTYDVTKKRTAGSSLGRIPVGVALGVVTAGQHGFVLVSGIHDAVKAGTAAGAIGIGDLLVPDANTDGEATFRPATYTQHLPTIGQALTTAAGGGATTIKALINLE